eukprot:8475515-Pyramimonas_sp.AAC.1
MQATGEPEGHANLHTAVAEPTLCSSSSRWNCMVGSWSCTARPTTACHNQGGEGMRPPIALMSTVNDA